LINKNIEKMRQLLDKCVFQSDDLFVRAPVGLERAVLLLTDTMKTLRLFGLLAFPKDLKLAHAFRVEKDAALLAASNFSWFL
jgi:hypothetical protein